MVAQRDHRRRTADLASLDSPVVTGTSGNDFIYAVGGNYTGLGRQEKNVVVAGNGAKNRITVGMGRSKRVTVGNGTKNRITVKGARTVVALGTGTRNRVVMTRGKNRSTCSLAAPPPSWRGTTARYYRTRSSGARW